MVLRDIKNLFTDNHKVFRFFLIFSMCCLTLFCIVAVMKNDASRDDMAGMVVINDLFCLVFLTFLLGYYLKGNISGATRYFTLFLLNLYATILFACLTYSVYGLSDHIHWIVLLSTLNYFFSMMLFLTLWLYQKQFIEESAMTRPVTVCILAALVIYAVVLIFNRFHPVLFHFNDEGLVSERMVDHISTIIDLICLVALCAVTLFSKLKWTRKLSFLCCILFPSLLTVLSLNMTVYNNNIYVISDLITFVMLPVFLIFYNTNDELEKEVLRREKEQIELQVSAMISQMQPHFLYNSLSVIAALCEEDPGLAAKATNTFSEYLRENIGFANKSEPISFSEELRHIEAYVWLEELRFPNKLKVEYDVKCTNFPVPALSVQPMVENAIKHGICKTRKGGTVRILTFETEGYYHVVVADDGAGFDASQAICDGKQHLGIDNSRYRIREMVGGSLDVASVPGEGTIVTIKIPEKL